MVGVTDAPPHPLAARFAQIVAAAVLALEVSAAASMASDGSKNFAQAHAVYGGARQNGSDPPPSENG